MIRKTFTIFALFIICFCTVLNVKTYCAYKTNSQKQYEAINNALEEYLSPYMNDTCNDYEKVLSFQVGGEYSRGGPWEIGEPITSWAIKYHVEVPDKNNTKWLPYVNKPDNLDEFEKAFEEYQESHNEIIQEEKVVVQAETNNKNSNEIIKIKNSIYTISIILIIISLLSIIIRKYRNK